MREQEGQGATCILLAAALSVIGAFAIKDPLKPEAVGVVSALRNMGLQCYMVTGDNWTTARIVAAELGIINVMAEVLPAGKAEKVRPPRLAPSYTRCHCLGIGQDHHMQSYQICSVKSAVELYQTSLQLGMCSAPTATLREDLVLL